MERKRFVREALEKALEVRGSLRIAPGDSLCVYDVARDLDIEVWYVDIASMEGMYVRGAIPRILLSAQRPRGRKAYNCAHELGHHVLGHGTRVDEYLTESARGMTETEEFLAQCFAGFLLMPPSTVSHAFAVRGWDPATCTPEQVYTIASWLGVGYTALLSHMSANLELVTQQHARDLSKIPLKRIRSRIVGAKCDEDVIVVDERWTSRPIDMEVGELIYVPGKTTGEGLCISADSRFLADSLFPEEAIDGALFRGTAPGVGRLVNDDLAWTAEVRVSRQGYIGWSIYQYLEEVEDE